jgi:tRNA A-37 threonylcarbamoyl transferase component Bud32
VTDSTGPATQPPHGYQSRRVGNTTLVATNDTIDALSSVIEQHDTLYAWARQVQQPRALRGRAPVFVATIPSHDDITIVVRHAWHGGLLAPLTRDVYRRPSRAPRELQIAERLRQAGVPTPQIVAYALYDAGPGLVRVDVASRYIDDSYDLAAVLAQHAPDIDRSSAFGALTLLLENLARNHFVHPDLNVKNVLIFRDSVRVLAAVLDVDVVEHAIGDTSSTVHARNVARLVRSMRKAPMQFGIQIAPDEYDAFEGAMSQVAARLT